MPVRKAEMNKMKKYSRGRYFMWHPPTMPYEIFHVAYGNHIPHGLCGTWQPLATKILKVCGIWPTTCHMKVKVVVHVRVHLPSYGVDPAI